MRNNNYNYNSLKNIDFGMFGYTGEEPICQDWFWIWGIAAAVRMIGPLFVLAINMGVPMAIDKLSIM